MERVVITGLGTVNPSGNSLKESWKNILIGKNLLMIYVKMSLVQS